MTASVDVHQCDRQDRGGGKYEDKDGTRVEMHDPSFMCQRGRGTTSSR